jgi:hypothetical protein
LVLKQGEVRTLPLLQTRARLPLQMEMLYLGMVEERFLSYARANNWETISSDREDPRWSRWQLRPGGEALYLPDSPSSQNSLEPPIYARGFYVQAYFVGGRLAGMHLIRNPEEPGFNLKALQRLIRAWFPDNRLMLYYQVLPEDPNAMGLRKILLQLSNNGQPHLLHQSGNGHAGREDLLLNALHLCGTDQADGRIELATRTHIATQRCCNRRHC